MHVHHLELNMATKKKNCYKHLKKNKIILKTTLKDYAISKTMHIQTAILIISIIVHVNNHL